MPLEIKCPGCGAAFRVKEEHAGKKMKCPKCAKLVTIPAADEDVIEEVEVVEEEEEKKPEAPAAADPFAFDGNEPAPKKGKSSAKVEAKPRGKTWGKYMPCPECHGREAKKVKWTWWGLGWGPRLVTHVRCLDCGATFNGKTGDSNLIPAVLFVSVPIVVFLVGLLITYIVLLRTGHWRWPPW